MLSVMLLLASLSPVSLELATEVTVSESPGEIRLQVRRGAYDMLLARGGGQVARFPLPGGQNVDLELQPFRVVSPNARFVNVGPEGTRELPAPDIRFFHGSVRGDVDSRVVLSLHQGRIAGVVRTAGVEYEITPGAASLAAPLATTIFVRDRREQKGGFDCGVTGEDLPTHADPEEELLPPTSRMSPLGGAQLQLDLALDSTTEWCAHFGNDVTAAQFFLTSLVAEMSAVYDAEVTVKIEIAFLRTFCGAADPYTDGLTSLADRSQLLQELDDEWTANMSGVARSTTHLISHSTDGNIAGGLARTFTCVGQTCTHVLCNDNSAYGVTLMPANGATPAGYETRVCAHELGHNHSSPHTNCLQDGGGQWISTCAIETCGSNPNCQATGCYPGPENDAIVGTIMSTGCDSSSLTFEDDTVEGIIRGAAEDASCVGAAGLPGEVREPAGLRMGKVTSCPSTSLISDDGGVNSNLGACAGCQLGWFKRFTPACYPFRLTDMEVRTSSVSAGRPLRIFVFVDPSGSGSPSAASLAHMEDVTVQVANGFSSYTLQSPVTIPAGDVYFGVYDLQADNPAPFIASFDTSSSGDSYYTINATDSGSFQEWPSGTFMIRGSGGPVPAGTVALTWGDPCNLATTPGQDFGVYRGVMGAFQTYSSLTCSTAGGNGYTAEDGTGDAFYLVVPSTTPSEGSYGRDSTGVERPPAASACKPQSFEVCP